jgi:hypothetical protein
MFSELIGKVKKESLSSLVGMRMWGTQVEVSNEKTKTSYRLFDKVSINNNGPFYRKRALPSDLPVPGIGTFEANTNEVRVLMFLHELGHAIKGQDGNWLLPDDGKSEDLSRQNSQKIENVCGAQIKGLRDRSIKNEIQPDRAHEMKDKL